MPQVVAGRLTADWTFNGPAATSHKVFWTLPAPDGGSLAGPQRPGQDVVLKTTQAACVRQLRAELKSRKLTTQPITCSGCEAVRFQGPDFEATIYSLMKGDYPFMIVVHQVPPVPAAGLPATGFGAKAAPLALHALDIVLTPTGAFKMLPAWARSYARCCCAACAGSSSRWR